MKYVPILGSSAATNSSPVSGTIVNLLIPEDGSTDVNTFPESLLLILMMRSLLLRMFLVFSWNLIVFIGNL